MKKLTVFTPTFNRAYCLHKLYESLCRQTCSDFEWLIVDDGSTDNTESIVKSWIKEKIITIRYIYKENGGMHSAHNTAYNSITTELNVCIDSDDSMPSNAVSKILITWAKIKNKSAYSGIVGLDVDINNTLIGSKFPDNVAHCTYNEIYTTYGVTGDKKFVLKTEALKKYPNYPEFKDEKLVPLGTLYIMMGEDKPFLLLNEPLCIVEYQPDGSSNTILKQYKQSPKGFAYARRIHLQYTNTFKIKIKSYIHITSSAIFARDITLLWKGVNPIYTIILSPLGILLNLYIRFKIKN